MTFNKVDVIGDDIENPFNAKAMVSIAGMFGSVCSFRDHKPVDEENPDRKIISTAAAQQAYASLIALDNLDSAVELYGFKLKGDLTAALVAGNERRGISHEMQKAATDIVQIPMFDTRLNTINVASATGVALYYLCSGFGGKLQNRTHPESRRPDMLFIGGTDHIELGSAIRSAGAFGWNRLLIEDRENIWFGSDRVTRSEARGAARRGRNAIRLVPVTSDQSYAYREVVVVSSKTGDCIARANLADGAKQLIVIPDESQVDVAATDWNRFGAKVRFVQVKTPLTVFNYHFRFFASVALAESARQIGRRPAGRTIRSARGPVYDSALSLLADERGEEIYLEDLHNY